MEFASVFASLGCKVTIVEAMERILPTMDREISQSLNMLLKKRGVVIHTGAMVEKIEQEDGQLVCCFTEKGKAQRIPWPSRFCSPSAAAPIRRDCLPAALR